MQICSKIIQNDKKLIPSAIKYYYSKSAKQYSKQVSLQSSKSASKSVCNPAYIMFAGDDSYTLKMYSTNIYNKNPCLTRTECMKIALRMLKEDKKLRKFIHIKSTNIKKNNPDMSYAESIKSALGEWKIMKQGSH